MCVIIHDRVKDSGVQVFAKNCTKAPSLDVLLCDIRKPLRIRCSWNKRSLAPLVTEEKSVAIPQFFKLLLDNAGKKGPDLAKKETSNLKSTKHKKLTIPSSAVTFSASPAVKPSICDGSLWYVSISFLQFASLISPGFSVPMRSVIPQAFLSLS